MLESYQNPNSKDYTMSAFDPSCISLKFFKSSEKNFEYFLHVCNFRTSLDSLVCFQNACLQSRYIAIVIAYVFDFTCKVF